jgi:hypothetical protein
MNIKFPQVLLVHKYDLIDMPIFSALGFTLCIQTDPTCFSKKYYTWNYSWETSWKYIKDP